MLIDTARLTLRKFTFADVDALFPILADPDVMKFSLKGPFSKQDTEKFIARCIESYFKFGYGMFAVILKENNALIGLCGFFDQVIDNIKEVELGYRFDKAYWGKGLASEAAIACRDYAYHPLGLTRLISIIEPRNVASVRVAQKAGLTFEKSTLFHDIPVSIYST